jgi:hypothetical protein
VNQILGPILFRFALDRSGEIAEPRDAPSEAGYAGLPSASKGNGRILP